ncbi:MAG TPA: GDCCVxC domain-containing (seleno)protein [Caulobacteraceae bacterium]
MSEVILVNELTCPHCWARRAETMPTDACLWLWDCPDCGTTLRPRPGDCCVFCSYGSVPCRPVQVNGRCGAPEG